MYKNREFSKFVYLYSTLNPIELRLFPHRKIARDALKRVINNRKLLGKFIALDKFEDLYSKSFKEEQSRSTIFQKIIYLLIILFIFDRVVCYFNYI